MIRLLQRFFFFLFFYLIDVTVSLTYRPRSKWFEQTIVWRGFILYFSGKSFHHSRDGADSEGFLRQLHKIAILLKKKKRRGKKIDQLVLYLLGKRRNEPNKAFHYMTLTVIFFLRFRCLSLSTISFSLLFCCVFHPQVVALL
jgi:hypothetical protein